MVRASAGPHQPRKTHHGGINLLQPALKMECEQMLPRFLVILEGGINFSFSCGSSFFRNRFHSRCRPSHRQQGLVCPIILEVLLFEKSLPFLKVFFGFLPDRRVKRGQPFGKRPIRCVLLLWVLTGGQVLTEGFLDGEKGSQARNLSVYVDLHQLFRSFSWGFGERRGLPG